MVGVVNTRHLVSHPRAIVHEFGMRCYLRCIWRTATKHGAVTFLECIECVEEPRERSAVRREPSSS
jgi:hypothetical protein